MGIIAELFEGLVMLFQASVGLFPTLVEILLVGGFLYFLLTKFWWKKETPPAPQPPATPDVPPSEDGKIRPL